METFSIVAEIMMIILFGISWPLNIFKAWRGRTAKGTSFWFTFFIAIGYVCGIVSKLFAAAAIGPSYWTFMRTFAFAFYFVNLSMVTASICIYFRNKKLDAVKEK